MSALTTFESSSLPSYLRNADGIRRVNQDVIKSAGGFPVLSIKGMKFTLVQDGVRRVVTKPDDPDEVAQSLNVVIVRANNHAKTFYAAKYSEGDSDGARPDCYSYDGQAPSPNAQNPQAKKCAICPHNQWGARVSETGEAKGKACADNARLAVMPPDGSAPPSLLRVPPASLKNLRELLKVLSQRKVEYNTAVVKIGFDREAPSPKLTFKPIDFLTEPQYRAADALFDDEIVRAIVGADDIAPEAPARLPAPVVDTSELDAAIAAREVANKAKAKAATPPAAKKPVEDDELAAAVAKPKAKPKTDTPSLMDDLDDLLGSSDD